ncbi:MAG: AcrB/AcrD/AcrF family protein [Acidobacteria bacterium]|nr:MAG: AcrB/AcrD/AcrF family protein [Acidobacteriota bacterium]
MSLPKFSVGNPVLVHLIVILTVLAGIAAYRQMPKSQYPDVAMAGAFVQTLFPGASPKEVEQLVTIPLEEEIAQVADIETIESTSLEGLSMIIVQFDLDSEHNFEKVTEIQNRIAQVQRFPEDAEPPVVLEMKPPFATATVAILGTAPEHEIKEFADALEDRLKTLPGVSEVRVTGVREREIWVEADPARLASYRLSLQDLATALQRRNLNLPGGLIRLDRAEFAVRTEAEFRDLDQIRDTVVRQTVADDGTPGFVRIADVATVRDTFEDRRSLARLDGAESVNLIVTKDQSANTLSVVDQIHELATEMTAQLPAGLEMRIVDDSSIEIRNRLSGLYSNLLLGLALVVLSISIFIGRRAALMVALGIPVSFLATFVVIDFIGYSIDTMVLFSLILVIGLVVDDAIVVCENIYRHYESGMSITRAAVHGTEQIMLPVSATIATTVAAFLPLLLMEGILGEFMSIIPVVVTCALLASLFEAFVILPSHVAEWGGRGKRRRAEESRPWFGRLLGHYRRALGFALRWRYLSVAAVLALAAFCLHLAFFRMDFVLFGGRDLESFAVTVEAPPGATIEETTRLLGEIEARALEITGRNGEADSVRTEVGSMQQNSPNRGTGSNVGEVVVDLVDLRRRERSGQAVRDELRDSLTDLTGARAIQYVDARDGPPVGKPVAVRISGDSFETLRQIADEVKLFLATVDGVEDIADNFPVGKDEVRPELDLERIAELGLDVRTVATEIRGAFDGLEATRVYDGDEEIEVMVKYAESERSSLAALADMQFTTPHGMVPFSSLASMARHQGISQIGHYFENRTIVVTADLAEGAETSTAVNRRLLEEFADLGQRYPGYTLTLGGEYEDTQESLASMVRALGISVVLIYVILGGLFRSFVQPLIVMCSVPFAFIGVVLGFWLLREPLGMFAAIGTIALAGIVVNDSLILIDFINRKRSEGLAAMESIVEASSMRLRPIILTSVTTILGLLPVALGLFGVDDFLKPMAIAIACGLIFSTVLCLGLIPCVYRIVDDLSVKVTGRHLAAREAPHWDVADEEGDAAGDAEELPAGAHG